MVHEYGVVRVQYDYVIYMKLAENFQPNMNIAITTFKRCHHNDLMNFQINRKFMFSVVM